MFKTLLSRRSEEPFFLITVLLLIIIAVYNWVIALLALILIGGAYVLTRKNHNERNREISQFFDAISKSVDQASTYAVQNLPIGIAIIDMQSNLCWANSVFRDWVGDIDNDQQLDHIMPNLKVDKFWGISLSISANAITASSTSICRQKPPKTITISSSILKILPIRNGRS